MKRLATLFDFEDVKTLLQLAIRGLIWFVAIIGAGVAVGTGLGLAVRIFLELVRGGVTWAW